MAVPIERVIEPEWATPEVEEPQAEISCEGFPELLNDEEPSEDYLLAQFLASPPASPS